MAEPEEEFEEFEDDDPRPLDDHESAMVRQDLVDLDSFEKTFEPEGYRGVSLYCNDCGEEHYYPWQMLRENLKVLLDTGETPVHEPAFAPDPDQYVPWEYARGYVDALHDVGVTERIELERCPRCRLKFKDSVRAGNFCPRCGQPLVAARLFEALEQRGIDGDAAVQVMREAGFPL